MPAQLNLQRNSKLFVSTIDASGGAVYTAFTPANTFQVVPLSYAPLVLMTK